MKRAQVTRHYIVPVRIRVTADDEAMLAEFAAQGARSLHVHIFGGPGDYEIVAVDPETRTADLDDPAPQLALFSEDAA